ncbi:MAG TPA: hypothetical protein VGJ33_17755 [Candidatus Angelobacter sp.]|jgi:5-methylcytosine-specific restriction protein B
MSKYFSIARIQQAIEHLSHFRSEWIIVPLVLAVNGVAEDEFVNPSAKGKAGTDKFLDQYFNASLLGLAPKGNGSVRPKFLDVTTLAGDNIAHQAVKLWGSHYSSRGYREMNKMGLLERQGPNYQVRPQFWSRWEAELPGFHFEELLVWLYAFSGFSDNINNWESLFIDFQQRNLGLGGRFPEQYTRKFNVTNAVPWPNDLLNVRPSNGELQAALIPSSVKKISKANSAKEIIPEKSVETIIGSFDAALSTAGVSFGASQANLVRNFVLSILAKPFVILTGLSGSGKTQIAKCFGEWLGEDKHMLVPVRPDWVAADAMLGYENLLDAGIHKAWVVPDVLQFILLAAKDKSSPYALILDEMNLAHVERYFGDFLSGMESRKAVIPNLVREKDETWKLRGGLAKIPVPENLIVLGTVNVDETTYMFSPKVLDRANCLEFRVGSDDLALNLSAPKSCAPAAPEIVRGIAAILSNREWQKQNSGVDTEHFADRLKVLHEILADGWFEFGHRTFFDSVRFAALFQAAGGEWKDALDAQIYQKILPRLHGSQRVLGKVIRALGHFCLELPDNADASLAMGEKFIFAENAKAELPASFKKLQRMSLRLKAQQFVSFIE